MNTKLISILTITCFLFLAACQGLSKKDAFLGVIATTFVGMALYHYMNKKDEANMQNVFENSPTGQTVGWQNPDTNIPYQMTVTNTSTNGGSYCRQYQTVGIIDGQRETLTGTACRQPDGFWKIQ